MRSHHIPKPQLRITRCVFCERQIHFDSGFFFEIAPRRIVHPDCFIYTRERGPVPAGSTLLHTCGDANCVNPAHLELRPEVR